MPKHLIKEFQQQKKDRLNSVLLPQISRALTSLVQEIKPYARTCVISQAIFTPPPDKKEYKNDIVIHFSASDEVDVCIDLGKVGFLACGVISEVVRRIKEDDKSFLIVIALIEMLEKSSDNMPSAHIKNIEWRV